MLDRAPRYQKDDLLGAYTGRSSSFRFLRLLEKLFFLTKQRITTAITALARYSIILKMFVLDHLYYYDCL